MKTAPAPHHQRDTPRDRKALTVSCPRRVIRSAIFAVLLAAAAPSEARADAVLDWSRILQQTTPMLEPVTIAHVAIHDSLNAVQRRYESYAVTVPGVPAASPEAAVATAAHTVVFELLPARRAFVQPIYEAYLAQIPDGPEKSAGIELGRYVALQEIARRRSLSISNPVSYQPGSGPGYWQPTSPTPPALLPLANTPPYALNDNSQFFPDAPPALDSDGYLRDYAEILDYGRADSTVRTDYQTNIARLWNGTSMVEAARQIATAHGLDLWENARLFAVVHLAQTDAGLIGARAKYIYNFWRPETAIATVDPTWRPLLPAPNHPEYVSNHTIQSAAIAAVLEQEFGTDNLSFSLSTPAAPGFIRDYLSLSETIADIVDARVWSGIHFRTSNLVGASTGAHIGKWIARRYLAPVGERGRHQAAQPHPN